MANIQSIEEATIAECFVCAIEYGDYSGLTDEEESQLNYWLENYPYCIFEYGDIDEYSRCEAAINTATLNISFRYFAKAMYHI